MTRKTVTDRRQWVSDSFLERIRLEELGRLLALINGLPARLPSFGEIQEARDQNLEIDVEPHTLEFIFDERHRFELAPEPVEATPRQRYDYLIEARAVIEKLTSTPDPPNTMLMPSTTLWRVNANRRISARPSILSARLEDFIADRIRRCKACSRWFYAWRKDKWSCSTSCASLLRMRRSRDPLQEAKRAKQRKENESYKRKRTKKRR